MESPRAFFCLDLKAAAIVIAFVELTVSIIVCSVPLTVAIFAPNAVETSLNTLSDNLTDKDLKFVHSFLWAFVAAIVIICIIPSILLIIGVEKQDHRFIWPWIVRSFKFIMLSVGIVFVTFSLSWIVISAVGVYCTWIVYNLCVELKKSNDTNNFEAQNNSNV